MQSFKNSSLLIPSIPRFFAVRPIGTSSTIALASVMTASIQGVFTPAICPIACIASKANGMSSRIYRVFKDFCPFIQSYPGQFWIASYTVSPCVGYILQYSSNVVLSGIPKAFAISIRS